MNAKWVVYCARALSLLWACWWVFFETAEASGSHQFGQAIFFAVAMLGAALIAWKWPVAGGAILILEGIGATVVFAGMWLRRFDLAGFLALFAIMCAPPLVSGILFLLSRPRAAAAPVR